MTKRKDTMFVAALFDLKTGYSHYLHGPFSAVEEANDWVNHPGNEPNKFFGYKDEKFNDGLYWVVQGVYND